MAAKKTTKKAPETGEKPETKKETKAVEAPAKTAAPKVQKVTSAAPSTEEDKVMLHLKTHGKEFVGVVISDKAHKTVTVEWERRRLIPKYERYERRYSRVYAHNPLSLNARHGDTVRIKETRPLSKTKNFVVVEIVKRAEVAQ